VTKWHLSRNSGFHSHELAPKQRRQSTKHTLASLNNHGANKDDLRKVSKDAAKHRLAISLLRLAAPRRLSRLTRRACNAVGQKEKAGAAAG
jgi:hypothetical protein